MNPTIIVNTKVQMNQVGNAALALGFICQVVDKDFYPLGDVFPVEILPTQYIGVVANQIKSSKRKTISDLGIIDDLVSIDDIDVTLWKLSKPYPLRGNDKNVAKMLQEVRRDPQSFGEMLRATCDFSDYFNGKLPTDHLHVLLQLAISGVGGENPFNLSGRHLPTERTTSSLAQQKILREVDSVFEKHNMPHINSNLITIHVRKYKSWSQKDVENTQNNIKLLWTNGSSHNTTLDAVRAKLDNKRVLSDVCVPSVLPFILLY